MKYVHLGEQRLTCGISLPMGTHTTIFQQHQKILVLFFFILELTKFSEGIRESPDLKKEWNEEANACRVLFTVSSQIRIFDV